MQHATYVHLYADEHGESHFEDLDIQLLPADFAPPAGLLNVAPFLPTAGSFWVGGDAGWHGEVPHPAPRRQILITLAGEYEVTASDGSVRSFGVGRVLVIEDTAGKGHSTRIISQEDLLVFGIALADE